MIDTIDKLKQHFARHPYGWRWETGNSHITFVNAVNDDTFQILYIEDDITCVIVRKMGVVTTYNRMSNRKIVKNLIALMG